MAKTLAISEQLCHSTVRIESEYTGQGIGTGTGFFYRFKDDGQRHVPAVVTNRHVVEGASRGRFFITDRDGDGNPKTGEKTPIVLDNFADRWIPHPDSDVDLCMLPIASIHTAAEQQGKTLFYVSLDKSLIPTVAEREDLTALEDIIMIGYPNGIWDEVNNMPIIRKGITATHPGLKYEGREEFMIDAACFPGSSGSPVFLFNLGGYTARDGGTVLGTHRIKLLGVLYAGPQHTAEGEVEIVTVPTQNRAIARSMIPNNLGLVIRSERLEEFESVLP